MKNYTTFTYNQKQLMTNNPLYYLFAILFIISYMIIFIGVAFFDKQPSNFTVLATLVALILTLDFKKEHDKNDKT